MRQPQHGKLHIPGSKLPDDALPLCPACHNTQNLDYRPKPGDTITCMVGSEQPTYTCPCGTRWNYRFVYHVDGRVEKIDVTPYFKG